MRNCFNSVRLVYSHPVHESLAHYYYHSLVAPTLNTYLPQCSRVRHYLTHWICVVVSSPLSAGCLWTHARDSKASRAVLSIYATSVVAPDPRKYRRPFVLESAKPRCHLRRRPSVQLSCGAPLLNDLFLPSTLPDVSVKTRSSPAAWNAVI